MLKSLTVTNHIGQSLVLTMGSPEQSGLSINRIDGLSPPKAQLNFTDVVLNDGAAFNAARLGTRNIVMELGMVSKNGIDTIEQSRHILYKYFPIKRRIRLSVESDFRNAWIDGYVEGNDVEIFSKTESAQVSIICPNPYFRAFYDGEVIFSGVEDSFTFPFMNNSLTQNLITFGNILLDKEKMIYYPGDARTGFLMEIRFLGNTLFPTVYNSITQEFMTLDTDLLQIVVGSNQFIANDIVYISTINRQKSITLLRDGVEWVITSIVSLDTNWLQLENGDNNIAFDAVSGVENMLFKVTYPILYEGV